LEVDPMFGNEYVGILASLVDGVGQSAVWFTVGAGLLLGVTLQIAAAIVAAYLVVTTLPAPHPVRHHRGPGSTRRRQTGLHASRVAAA
jgi:hypothetical protein